MKLGSHVSLSGSTMFLGAVEEALSYGATALMVYTGAPQNTIRKNIEQMRIEEAKLLLEKHNIPLSNVIVHAPYIVNLANKEKHDFAVDFLTKELIRSHAMGAKHMVLHPGAHVGAGVDEAIDRIAKGVNQILENTQGLDTTIALETMAGKGTEIGRNFHELKRIINQIQDQDRVTVCFDTCHTHDSGYDVKDNFEAVIQEFDQIIGLNKLSVFHLNDSKNVKGAQKDRHENIGFGEIGHELFFHIVHDERFENIPKILETPYVEDIPPYKHEIAMLREKNFNPNILEHIKNQT